LGQKKALPGKISGVPLGSLPAGLHLMNAVAVSGTNTYTSDTFNAADFDNCGLEIVFTGTMVGTLEITASISNSNFIPLTFSPVLSQPTGSNLKYLVNLNQFPFPYYQVSYTNASGSGTLDVWSSGKDLN